MLEKELEYFIKNQGDLVEKYGGKYIVIKNQKIIGEYDSEIDAYNKTQEKHELGTFMIQHCMPGVESYTQAFQSRAIFS